MLETTCAAMIPVAVVLVVNKFGSFWMKLNPTIQVLFM